MNMSLCAICHGKIEDGLPYDEEHLGYDHCEDEQTPEEYYDNR